MLRIVHSGCDLALILSGLISEFRKPDKSEVRDPERRMVMRRSSSAGKTAIAVALLLSAMVGLGLGARAQAGSITLDIAAAAGADVAFTGTGAGASFKFNTTGTEDFQITGSTGVGDSVGLYGTIGGTFSYTKASIVTVGSLQTAPVSASGSLTITDGSGDQLKGTVAGIDVSTFGTAGIVNLNGVINLTGVTYAGSNSDLRQLTNDAAASGGIVSISFQFGSPTNLTALAGSGASNNTSYSGTITAASVPEPSSGVLAAMGMISLLGHRLRPRKRPCS
jgi:hypothetical protein